MKPDTSDGEASRKRPRRRKGRNERRPRMSERVCQFFLRGRCQRQKCEFRHPADHQVGPRGPISERSGGGANKDTLCKFFLSTGCKFGASCHFRHVGRERRRSRFVVCKTQNPHFRHSPLFDKNPTLSEPPYLRKYYFCCTSRLLGVEKEEAEAGVLIER